MDTHCYVTSATVSGFDGTSSDYTLTTSVLEIIDIYPTTAGYSYGLQRVSVPDLLELRRLGPTAASSPATFYALAGHNTLMFYPTPGTADTFTMYYVPVPTALSVSSDDPSSASLGGIPTQFHKAIEYYALSEAADANDDASSQQGAKYFQLYQAEIQRLRRVLKRRGGSRGQRAIVGPRGSRRNGFLHRNDVY